MVAVVGAVSKVSETKGNVLKLISRAPEFLQHRKRRSGVSGPPPSAECLEVRLNLSAVVMGAVAMDADVFSMEELFDDDYQVTDLYGEFDASINEFQPDAWTDEQWSFDVVDMVSFEHTFSDEVFDDSLWVSDFAAEDVYYYDDLTDPFADAAYYELYDLSSEYTDDSGWWDDVTVSDEWLWAQTAYWDWLYEQETAEPDLYVYDTTAADDLSGVFDDSWYFPDDTYYTDTATDAWLEIFVQDSSSLVTGSSETNVEDSGPVESAISAANQITVDTPTVVAGTVQSSNVAVSQFTTAMTYVPSVTGFIRSKVEFVDAGSERQNTGRSVPATVDFLLMPQADQTKSLYSSTESFPDGNRVQRHRERSNDAPTDSVRDRSELLGRLDQLFREFSHLHGVAAEFDQFELPVMYPGQSEARMLRLLTEASDDTQSRVKTAGMPDVNLLQDPSEPLGSHEAVGAIVAVGLAGAAARSGWMLRRRREHDMQVAATRR